MFGFMSYIWLALMLLLLIIEASTMGLTTIWFAIGSLVAMILSLFDLPVWLQLASFISVSVVLLVFTRPLFMKSLKKGIQKTNVNSVPGQVGLVCESIDPIEGSGLVKLKGQMWSAKSWDGMSVIPAGIQVEVTAVEGVKLVVKPAAVSGEN